jgi:hypothetical protein
MTPLTTAPTITASEPLHSPPCIHPKHKRNKIIVATLSQLVKLISNGRFHFPQHGQPVKTAIVTNPSSEQTSLHRHIKKANNLGLPNILKKRLNDALYHKQQINHKNKPPARHHTLFTPTNNENDALHHEQKVNPKDKPSNPSNNHILISTGKENEPHCFLLPTKCDTATSAKTDSNHGHDIKNSSDLTLRTRTRLSPTCTNTRENNAPPAKHTHQHDPHNQLRTTETISNQNNTLQTITQSKKITQQPQAPIKCKHQPPNIIITPERHPKQTPTQVKQPNNPTTKSPPQTPQT